MKKTIYNLYNLKNSDINEKTIRTRAIIVNSDNKVLMCYSNGLKHYEFPGGHLEKGETLNTCLEREILEETGIKIDAKKIKPFYAIKNYCKNYRSTHKNRLVEIYYYIIYTDLAYDESKRNLDINEMNQDYECKYIDVFNLKSVLEKNKKTTLEDNSALDDMLLIWNEFLKIYEGK